MSDQIRTTEEIEQLKTNWKNDPIWDIEDTTGFEAHYDELKAWREEYEAEINERVGESLKRRTEKVMEATGLGKADQETLLYLHTFSEIEINVKSQNNLIGGFETPEAIVMAELTQAQVRATLLQAAQLKRIADALERIEDGDTLSNSVKIYGSGE